MIFRGLLSRSRSCSVVLYCTSSGEVGQSICSHSHRSSSERPVDMKAVHADRTASEGATGKASVRTKFT